MAYRLILGGGPNARLQLPPWGPESPNLRWTRNVSAAGDRAQQDGEETARPSSRRWRAPFPRDPPMATMRSS